MKKKKILFLSPLPPPYYGSALSSAECLDILKNSGNFKVRNIKLNYSRKMSDIGKINLEKIRGFLRGKKEIKKLLKKFHPELIYFVPATDGLGLIRDYLFFRDIKKIDNKQKIVLHIRSRIPKENWRKRLFKRIYTEIFGFSNTYVIVLGEELIADLNNLVPRKRIFILPNAIKNEIGEKELKEIIKKRAKESVVNILFLSNMDKTKGWPKLLQACKILNEKGIEFRCFFAGAWVNEQDKKYFFEFVRKNNLEKKIVYIGPVGQNEKKRLLEKTHILVFPTEYKLETFGRVNIEAMMFAIPVIANAIATIPSIVKDKKTGFLLEKNTPEEIAEKIEILAKNRKLAERMGIEGRKRFLKNFEIEKYKREFIKILRKI